MGNERGFEPGSAEDRAWLQALVRRANGGDSEALAGVREFLDRNPQVGRAIAGMGARVEKAWVRRIACDDVLVAESLAREADRLRAELLGDSPTATVRLLVDQVVVSLLELRYRQLEASMPSVAAKGETAKQAARLDSAHRRHIHALKTLEVVRGLKRKSRRAKAPL